MSQIVERLMTTGTELPATSKIGRLFFLVDLATPSNSKLYGCYAVNTWTEVTNAGSLATTDNLTEGSTNKYYTDARVLTKLAALVTDSEDVKSAGTVYTLTNTQAAVDFGTTDPAIVLGAAGTYLLFARARVEHVGATYAANRTITIKLRRTNNTAADVSGSDMVITTGVITIITGGSLNVNTFAIYTTTNTDDAIAMYAGIDTVASAGSSVVSQGNIIAIRIA